MKKIPQNCCWPRETRDFEVCDWTVEEFAFRECSSITSVSLCRFEQKWRCLMTFTIRFKFSNHAFLLS